jgi:ABC-type branched-subunit amino acid transport system substrate-binding protein
VNRARLALLILSAGMLAACGKVERRVRIAVLADLTGPRSVSGAGIRRAAALALEDQRGALLAAGWNVELAAFDANIPVPEWVTTLHTVAADPEVVCAVAHSASGGNLSAADIFHSAGLALVLPAETAAPPSAASRPETVFFSPADRTHGESDAEWALSQSAARILLTTNSDGHALAIADGFRIRAQSGGSAVYTLQIQTGQGLSGWMASFKSIHPDLVYFSGSSSLAGSIIQQMAASGSAGPFFFAQSEPEDPLPADFDSESIRLLFSPATADSAGVAGVSALEEKYRAAYGAEPPALAALGYDAASLCLSLLLKRKAGDGTPSAVRSRVTDLLQAGGMFQGVTGSYPLTGNRPGRVPVFSRAENPGSGWIPLPES